jgi:hypothetical protein
VGSRARRGAAAGDGQASGGAPYATDGKRDTDEHGTDEHGTDERGTDSTGSSAEEVAWGSS